MAGTHGDALLNAAKNALDALERLSHEVQFGALDRLRKAIQDAENERRHNMIVPLTGSPPPRERRARRER